MAHTAPPSLKVLALLLAAAAGMRSFEEELLDEAELLDEVVNLDASANGTANGTVGNGGPCAPWHKPPCENCLTEAGEVACRKSRIADVIKEKKDLIKSELAHMESRDKNTKAQWQKSVACRLIGHTGVFASGKVACMSLVSLVASPACIAAGIATAGPALLACGAAVGLLCNAIATVSQAKLHSAKLMGPACEKLGFPNPVPAEYQVF